MNGITLQQQCLLRNRGDVLEHQKLLIASAWRRSVACDPGVSSRAALRRGRESFTFAEREGGVEPARYDRDR
jgi:hypothetical protein